MEGGETWAGCGRGWGLGSRADWNPVGPAGPRCPVTGLGQVTAPGCIGCQPLGRGHRGWTEARAPYLGREPLPSALNHVECLGGGPARAGGLPRSGPRAAVVATHSTVLAGPASAHSLTPSPPGAQDVSHMAGSCWDSVFGPVLLTGHLVYQVRGRVAGHVCLPVVSGPFAGGVAASCSRVTGLRAQSWCRGAERSWGSKLPVGLSAGWAPPAPHAPGPQTLR